MAKAVKAAEQAVKTTGGMMGKVKDVGKRIGGAAKSAGAKAKAHVSRNRAAYIAGGAGLGAGLAAGGITGAALGRKKTPQEPE